jgi:hypothetical protein
VPQAPAFCFFTERIGRYRATHRIDSGVWPYARFTQLGRSALLQSPAIFAARMPSASPSWLGISATT